MFTFALHLGQPLAWACSPSTRRHDKPCRGSLFVLPSNGGGPRSRLPELNLPGPNDSRQFFPALKVRVSTLGVR